MQAITLQEAYRLIEQSSAAIIDDHALCFPALSELTGDNENQWLYFSWTDEDCDYSSSFIEEPTEIFFDGSSIHMEDSEGLYTKITLLVKYVDKTPIQP